MFVIFSGNLLMLDLFYAGFVLLLVSDLFIVLIIYSPIHVVHAKVSGKRESYMQVLK